MNKQRQDDENSMVTEITMLILKAYELELNMVDILCFSCTIFIGEQKPSEVLLEHDTL